MVVRNAYGDVIISDLNIIPRTLSISYNLFLTSNHLKLCSSFPESLLAFRPEELTDDELNQLLEQLEAGEDLELKKETNSETPGIVVGK